MLISNFKVEGFKVSSPAGLDSCSLFSSGLWAFKTAKVEQALRELQGAQAQIIVVRDNGIGISQEVVNKIFQPFFTTKPTGQGTGLGLSVSYDIIKAHNGEIRVDSKEGEHSEFVIKLPLQGS